MFRIDNSTAVPVLPIVPPPGTPGFFYRGNPATATEATIVDDWYLNLVQEELAFVIEQFPSSQVLNKFSTRQLYDAIISIAQWVTNGIIGNYLPLWGGTMQGYITLHAWPTESMHAVPMSWVQAQGYLTDAPGGAWYVRSAGQWGDLNSFGFATQSYVQSQINSQMPDVSGFLPISGGTLTGPGSLQVGNGTEIANFSVPHGNASVWGQFDVGGTLTAGGLQAVVDCSIGQDLMVTRDISTVYGDLTIFNGSAMKPGGGPFDAVSDSRTKASSTAYERGLDVITKLQPVSYTYNGTARTPTDKTFIGLIADDAVEVMPEIVGKRAVDGEEYLTVDAGPVLWALVNSVKQLDREIASLRAARDAD